jgi:hypothetical protein
MSITGRVAAAKGGQGSMDAYIQILVPVIAGMLLLWLGYRIFFGMKRRTHTPAGMRKKSSAPSGPGSPRSCPVCSAQLFHGEQIQSVAFPPSTGTDRLMHISGCIYCMNGGRRRICPVCGAVLVPGEVLIARFFEKPPRSHVHVLGCSQCRGPAAWRR